MEKTAAKFVFVWFLFVCFFLKGISPLPVLCAWVTEIDNCLSEDNESTWSVRNVCGSPDGQLSSKCLGLQWHHLFGAQIPCVAQGLLGLPAASLLSLFHDVPTQLYMKPASCPQKLSQD